MVPGIPEKFRLSQNFYKTHTWSYTVLWSQPLSKTLTKILKCINFWKFYFANKKMQNLLWRKFSEQNFLKNDLGPLGLLGINMISGIAWDPKKLPEEWFLIPGPKGGPRIVPMSKKKIGFQINFRWYFYKNISDTFNWNFQFGNFYLIRQWNLFES